MSLHEAKQGMLWTLSDIATLTRRNLLRYIRMPQLLIFSTIQPVMFLLLFTYVFGGAIQMAGVGVNYINYLLPGVIVQTVIFGAMQTGIGLADDLSKGLIDRFRSLPMARSAVLAGRTISDMIRNVFVVLLMSGVGFLIGFRFHQSLWDALAAIGLTVLFGFVFSWISASIGIAVRSVETAQVAGFIWVFPLVFASSIFVPVKTMPGWLQAFANVSPITVTVNSVRALVLGFPLGSDLWQMCLWMIGILAVFVPLAIYQYRKTS